MKKLTVVTRCPFCDKRHAIIVNDADFAAWQNGELIQNALPYLSADEREMLISGICPHCWDTTFGE